MGPSVCQTTCTHSEARHKCVWTKVDMVLAVRNPCHFFGALLPLVLLGPVYIFFFKKKKCYMSCNFTDDFINPVHTGDLIRQKRFRLRCIVMQGIPKPCWVALSQSTSRMVTFHDMKRPRRRPLDACPTIFEFLAENYNSVWTEFSCWSCKSEKSICCSCILTNDYNSYKMPCCPLSSDPHSYQREAPQSQVWPPTIPCHHPLLSLPVTFSNLPPHPAPKPNGV